QINRSLQPFAQNANAGEIIDIHNRACGTIENPRHSAVNSTLRVLSIERTAPPNQLAGLMVFYAIHPTVLRSRSPLYSGDLVDAAMLQLERVHELRGTAIVSGFFNGAEGDVI